MARTNRYANRRNKGIVTPYGQWLYPGQVTTIPDNNITMLGVPYPVFGVSDKGDAKMMLPGMDYLFKGNEVTEYPVMQRGGFGRKRVEKNGMEYLPNTDGYTGVVQKQTQHGLGVSRRYDAPVYQYYDNGNPVGESWKGAGDFQNDVVKDYESEPVAPFSRKYSNYDPSLLTSFKDLSTGETPFSQYLHPAISELINMPVPSFPAPAVPNKQQTPFYTQPAYSAPYANEVPNVGTRNWYEADTDKTVDDYINELQPFMEMIEGRRTNAYQVDGEKQYTIGIGHGNVNIRPTDVWDDEKINSTYISDMRSRADAIDGYFKSRNVNLNPRVLAGLAAYSFSRPYARVMEASPKLTQAIISGDFDAIRKEMDWGEKRGNNRRIVKKHDDLYDWMTLGDFRYGEKYQDGGIHINPKNKGKFTEAAQRAGKSVQAYAAQILANKDNYSPTLIKRANFARNSAKWKRQEGGDVIKKYLEGNYFQPKTVDSVMGAWNRNLAEVTSDADEKARWAGMILGAAGDVGVALGTKFGKDFTKPIMAGQKNKNSAAAPVTIPEFNLDEDLLKTSQEMEAADYIEEPVSPSVIMYEKQYDRNQQLLNQQVPMTAPRPYVDTRKQWFFDPRQINVGFGKFAAGGKLAPNAEIEHGEIAETVGGAEQANGNTNYHISMTDKNETTKNQVTFTNNVHEDVKNNPQLTKLPIRQNKYTNARRKGIPYVQVGGMVKQVPFYNEYALMNGTDGKEKTFLYPSTVTIGGRITEPVDRTHYPLAEYINQKFLS